MNFGSLFSGIEGIGLGLIWAGMRCIWHVENNEFCQKVLTKYWPDVPKYGDIRDVGKQNLETVDLIAGGFPCQPFSVAGKRRGTKDDRHLWPEMLRVISELKPAWVLGENVPGIIPLFLDQAISDLEAEGYTCEAFVLPACAFDAPHRRDRLFIIAYDSRTRARMESGGNGGSSGQRGQSSNTPKSEILRQEHGEGSSEGIEASNRFGITSNTTINGFNRCGKRGVLQGGQQQSPDKEQSGDRWSSIPEGYYRWLPEPGVGRVAHGVPNRVDRLKSLGNAVVPQLAEFLGRIIIEANNNG